MLENLSVSSDVPRFARKQLIRNGLPRWMEVPTALAALVLLSPVLAICAVAILLDSPGPVIFRQNRVGRNFREFTMYKLRTMQSSAKGSQLTAAGDRRVTLVGRFLRKTKLDEIPELWNVVRGDMSLVGPRPEVRRHIDTSDPLWGVILEARPGITDAVTLRLRNEEQLIALAGDNQEHFYLTELLPFKLIGSIDYLRSRNWLADLKVLFLTAAVVVWPRLAPPPTIEEVRKQYEMLSNQWRLEGICLRELK